MHIGFIPISPGFDHHRFCEPEHENLFKQFFSKDVWLWNLSYINGGNEVSMPTLQYNNGTLYMGQADGDDAANYADGGIASGGGNEVKNGWRYRPFHPKKDGHTAIKDAIIARFKADKVTGVV